MLVFTVLMGGLLGCAAVDPEPGAGDATCGWEPPEWHVGCLELLPEGCADRDRDGVTEADGDCDDLDCLVYPDAPEYEDCDSASVDVHGGGDGRDNDCDGLVDEDIIVPEEVCDAIDNDCDGDVDEGLDCEG
ncbi:MAG: MopE-related protein [Myxococcota bacterium]